jgi:hypothetical protein
MFKPGGSGLFIVTMPDKINLVIQVGGQLSCMGDDKTSKAPPQAMRSEINNLLVSSHGSRYDYDGFEFRKE